MCTATEDRVMPALSASSCWEIRGFSSIQLQKLPLPLGHGCPSFAKQKFRLLILMLILRSESKMSSHKFQKNNYFRKNLQDREQNRRLCRQRSRNEKGGGFHEATVCGDLVPVPAGGLRVERAAPAIPAGTEDDPTVGAEKAEPVRGEHSGSSRSSRTESVAG